VKFSNLTFGPELRAEWLPHVKLISLAGIFQVLGATSAAAANRFIYYFALLPVLFIYPARNLPYWKPGGRAAHRLSR
jgi:hypothetical protein